MNADVMNMLSSVLQDPDAMEKAMSMANMLASSGILDAVQAKNDEPSSTETKAETTATKSNGQISMNERIALLLAIRPYLKSDKAQKLDSVIRILKIVGTIEKSGVKLF